MEPCKKRQKIVKKPSNEVRFRCMNDKCSFMGNVVDEGICSRCPVRAKEHKKPCAIRRKQVRKQPAPAPGVFPTEEMLNISDEEVREMIQDAGLDMEELEQEVLQREPTPEGEVPSYPPLSMQAWFYKEALIRWNKAGRPKRSDDEVRELLDGHCKVCSWFDAEKNRCKGCGCAISESSIAIFNKLRMGTEHCPQEKW